MKDHNYYVYMMTNQSHRSLYTGVTNSLGKRIREHQIGIGSTYTKKYKVTKLVYFEHYFDINDAIAREKQIKGLLRSKKNKIVEAFNPGWKDLSLTILRDPSGVKPSG